MRSVQGVPSRGQGAAGEAGRRPSRGRASTGGRVQGSRRGQRAACKAGGRRAAAAARLVHGRAQLLLQAAGHIPLLPQRRLRAYEVGGQAAAAGNSFWGGAQALASEGSWGRLRRVHTPPQANSPWPAALLPCQQAVRQHFSKSGAHSPLKRKLGAALAASWLPVSLPACRECAGTAGTGRRRTLPRGRRPPPARLSVASGAGSRSAGARKRCCAQSCVVAVHAAPECCRCAVNQAAGRDAS